MRKEILIVDDKPQFCDSLAENLDNLGYRSRCANSGAAARAEMDARQIQLVLLDIVLGEESGLDVLRSIRAANPAVPVIMITGYATVATAVEAMKLGALDYIQKPLNITVLSKLIDNALARPSRAAGGGGEGAGADTVGPTIITRSLEMNELLRKAARFAETDLPVLICGENGTGKEVLADFIHYNSPRRARPMMKINCSAFPESLLDNELFGHDKGAYTGADSSFRGVFEKAHGGTLFLDEIGDMLPATQAKILRALQNNEIRRIGGNETIRVDVRFIAATNKDVGRMVTGGIFREDLLYRLNAATLQLPPLRARKEDIPLLVDYFLERHAEASGRKAGISADALNAFLSHSWPGNLRELKNTIFYAASLASDDTIGVGDLPPALVPAAAADGHGGPGSAPMDDVERLLIAAVMKECGNNKKLAAEKLRISRNTLYSKLKKYGLRFEE